MSRAKRVFTAAGVATVLWWVAMVWWGSVLEDPIIAKMGALVGPIGFLLLALLFALPMPAPDPRRISRYPQDVYDPIAEQRELDEQHQRHLAEQARMFYLRNRSTPPTDWYPH